MLHVVDWSKQIDTSLTWFLRAVLGGLLVGLVFLESTQVILRYFFALGLPWARDVSTIGLMWLAWLGAPLLWMKRSHISVDFIPVPNIRSLRRVGQIVLQLSMAVSGGFLLYHASEAAARYAQIDLTSIPGAHANQKFFPVMVGSFLLILVSFTALVRKD